MIEAGFDPKRAWIVRPDSEEIDGVRCVPEVKDLPERVDLFVLAVGADQTAEILEALVEHDKAIGVILIAGGMGEKEGGESIEARVRGAIHRGRELRRPLVANGGNCLGIVSRPGHYHTLFIPQSKLPLRADGKSNVAFISQSGAYMITRMSKLDWLSPRYAVSTGNQVDLTVGDFLRHLALDEQVRTFAVYSEGFKDGDGLACAKAIREITDSGRDVIFYKAGRTSEGKKATSGHTASLAGDYDVCEAIVARAGAWVAATFNDFLDLVKVSALMGDREWKGRGLAGFSNAGYEAVGIADAVRGPGWDLKLAAFTPETTATLQRALAAGKVDGLVDVHNPLDLTPMADDAANAAAVQAFLADPNVDVVLAATVPLTPAMATLGDGVPEAQSFRSEGSLVSRLARIASETRKPIAASVDSGVLYDAYARALEEKGIPRSAPPTWRSESWGSTPKDASGGS
jgi:acyl-CoA synthetase (NDP forming)